MREHTVTILGFAQAYASAITGVLDLFALAGVSWDRLHGNQARRHFRTQLASLRGEPVRCINHITLDSHLPIESVTKTDLLLIPTIGGPIESVLADNQALLPHIRRLYAAGSDVASNCSGAFFLAEAGLLDGRPATTHWGYADKFRDRYPAVNLQAEKLITEQDRIACSGGGMAWFDLSLSLIERYCGHDVAIRTAKTHLLDLSRNTQAAYAQLRPRKYHQDPAILAVQDAMERRYAECLRMEQLAKEQHLSSRTLIRRFRLATGQTPLQYLQDLRIEAAKHHLESSAEPIERIIQKVGYEDQSSFTRLFRQATGLTPSQYRRRFSRPQGAIMP